MAGQSQAVHSGEPSVAIRRASAADAEVCGRICFEAFSALANRHNFPPDFPAPEACIGVLSTMFSHPGFYCVVAEQDGKIIGSNCMDERTAIAATAPHQTPPTPNRKPDANSESLQRGHPAATASTSEPTHEREG